MSQHDMNDIYSRILFPKIFSTLKNWCHKINYGKPQRRIQSNSKYLKSTVKNNRAIKK